MHDPALEAAARMEAAERARGVQHADSCLSCGWREEAFGRAVCMNRRVTGDMNRDQFHKCVKRGMFWRAYE